MSKNKNTEAYTAKIAAMAQVEANANQEWSDYMLEQVRLTCMRLPRFTADAVFERASADPAAPGTHDLRAFGPVMTRAAKLGYCQLTNTTIRSSRASCHNRPLAVWESLICETVQA
jgi:hypothetical protein